MTDETKATSLSGLLDQLEPVPEPPAVAMYPQTFGWAIVAGLLFCLLIWAVWAWRRHRRSTAYRRAALSELDRAGDDRATIAVILRRTALASFPRAQVAGLVGDEWAAFLDETYKGTGFGSVTGQSLLSAPYTGSTRDPEATALARDWILRHKSPSEVR